jgi:hypothetical protein
MYPFGWLAVIIPLPLGFNILVSIHLIWGGLGLYLLLKREGLSHISALLASFSFVLLPKIYSHYGAGHLTFLYAIPWTPWLLWSQVSFYNKTRSGRTILVPPGLILAILIYADVRWGIFAALLWWSYALIHKYAGWRKVILGLIGQSIVALLLAAPLLLPLAEYTFLSTRAALESGEVLSFSLPVSGLFGFFLPNSKGYHEWVLYSGGAVIVLTLTSIFLKLRVRNWQYWSGLLIVSLLIALGPQVPGIAFLSNLPIVNFLRVPSRSLFIAGMSLSALAGYGLEGVIQDKKPLRSAKQIQLAMFGLLVFSIALAGGIFFFSGESAPQIFWGAVMLAVAIFWVIWGISKKVSKTLWILGIILIIGIDLGVVSANSLRWRSARHVIREGDASAAYLSDKAGEFRTYSPSYSIPQQTAVEYQLELSDGIDPLQLGAYREFMESATGVPNDTYSVTLPSYDSGDPRVDNAGYSPDPERLGLLNVGYVIAEYDLPVEGLTLEAQFDKSRIYKNEFRMPRAWVQTNNSQGEKVYTPAEIVSSTPNQILLTAVGPGSLILSEIVYPGWEVDVVGQSSEINSYLGLLRAVELSPGRHVVEFKFKPLSLRVGVGILLLGIISLIWFIHYQRKVR